ncbi:hypothetical protein AV530_009342 [Patagioenas fasciata monilis]|uniref:Uncharacterized protein n=1 Tax=Patagioenas fasciata monilis TaxID=372326 RepID=A0A1V4JIK3_PATFA|nr:hypothetical protein AV530_009342 [Patagioenas fasciata monilis]
MSCVALCQLDFNTRCSCKGTISSTAVSLMNTWIVFTSLRSQNASTDGATSRLSFSPIPELKNLPGPSRSLISGLIMGNEK